MLKGYLWFYGCNFVLVSPAPGHLLVSFPLEVQIVSIGFISSDRLKMILYVCMNDPQNHYSLSCLIVDTSEINCPRKEENQRPETSSF